MPENMLPAQVPFNVYFLNHEGEVWPKKVYTVTRKLYHSKSNCFELYIMELKQYIAYDAEKVVPIAGISANENVTRYCS